MKPLPLGRGNSSKELSSKYDAVWFKGKGIRRLLDGDQICVFNVNNIFEIDHSLSQPMEIGSKVRRKSDGMIGRILKKEDIKGWPTGIRNLHKWLTPETKMLYTIVWNKGGTQRNIPDYQLEPK